MSTGACAKRRAARAFHVPPAPAHAAPLAVLVWHQLDATRPWSTSAAATAALNICIWAAWVLLVHMLS
eukprot:scaffold94961_cov68-Phaeocystis_antarctica.AAC.1